MALFAGHYGQVDLQRLGGDKVLHLLIQQEDAYHKRNKIAFSVDKDTDLDRGVLRTGDRIKVATKDDRGLPVRLYENLSGSEFVDNPSEFEAFIYCDPMGSVSFYRAFRDAMKDSKENRRLEVLESDGDTEITLEFLAGSSNEVGFVTGFRYTTDRETVDVTALGEKFRGFQASAISGSGSIDCVFDFSEKTEKEIPATLANLVQRADVGARFNSRLYILEPFGDQPPGLSSNQGVWYEVNGLMTKVAFNVRAGSLVDVSFDFVSSGAVDLQYGATDVSLITENNINMKDEIESKDLGFIEQED